MMLRLQLGVQRMPIVNVTPYEETEYAFCPVCHATSKFALYVEQGKEPVIVCSVCIDRAVAEEPPAVEDDDDPVDDDSDGTTTTRWTLWRDRLVACTSQSCKNFTHFSCRECGDLYCTACLDANDYCPKCVADYGHYLVHNPRPLVH